MSAIFTGLAPVSDDDLVRLSHENPRYRFESDDNGALRMSPAYSAGGAKTRCREAAFSARTLPG